LADISSRPYGEQSDVERLAGTPWRQMIWPQIAAHHEDIVEMVTAGVTQATIHQRLRDEHRVAPSGQAAQEHQPARTVSSRPNPSEITMRPVGMTLRTSEATGRILGPDTYASSITIRSSD